MRTKVSTEEKPLTLDELEREHIQNVLRANGGNKNRSARELGIDRRTLYRKLAKYEQQGQQGAEG